MKRILLLLPLVLMISCSRNQKIYVIGIGEKIHHDDFEYSVTNYLISRFLRNGRDTIKADGAFYIITFRTDNLAKRISHEWDNSIAVIVDEKGREFGNLPDVQKFWEKARSFGLKEKYITPAGKSDSTVLAFDLPFDATKPYLKVRGEILMGDAFDRARFRRTFVKLY
jgi:hypothetical protein